jgi:hypothetical protein
MSASKPAHPTLAILFAVLIVEVVAITALALDTILKATT